VAVPANCRERAYTNGSLNGRTLVVDKDVINGELGRWLAHMDASLALRSAGLRQTGCVSVLLFSKRLSSQEMISLLLWPDGARDHARI
jgi:hypothetical protein